MTKFLILPGIRRSALSCVWIETGNPKLPLACIWVDSEMRIALDAGNRQEQAQPCCARIVRAGEQHAAEQLQRGRPRARFRSSQALATEPPAFIEERCRASFGRGISITSRGALTALQLSKLVRLVRLPYARRS